MDSSSSDESDTDTGKLYIHLTVKIKTIVIITGTQGSTIRVSNWRSKRSVDKLKLDQLQDAQRKSTERSMLSAEKYQEENFKAAERMATQKASFDEEQLKQYNLQKAQMMATKKATFNEEELKQYNLKKAQSMANLRQSRNTKLPFKAATLSEDIFEGSMKVLPLEETSDSIGKMNKACPHCGALKFVGETASSCCLNGQINIKPLPKPPPPILNLWTGNDVTSRIFRQHSRILNNAVCLSSIKVGEKKDGFSPSVIFQGKLMHLAGSISQIDGETPHYAQLYVLDSEIELTQRYL